MQRHEKGGTPLREQKINLESNYLGKGGHMSEQLEGTKRTFLLGGPLPFAPGKWGTVRKSIHEERELYPGDLKERKIRHNTREGGHFWYFG